MIIDVWPFLSGSSSRLLLLLLFDLFYFLLLITGTARWVSTVFFIEWRGQPTFRIAITLHIFIVASNVSNNFCFFFLSFYFELRSKMLIQTRKNIVGDEPLTFSLLLYRDKKSIRNECENAASASANSQQSFIQICIRATRKKKQRTNNWNNRRSTLLY